MCDTLWKAFDGYSVFAKNSDRSVNEPNLTIYVEGKVQCDDTVDCTYISVPQVKKTYSTLLVKPSWLWGAEMGVNECGVAIGNEAVFTLSKGKKIKRLTGMDMLRLALERADTAESAKNIIIELLNDYGQGGNCGFDKSFYYDNSFLIADKNSALILETSGKDWAIKKLDGIGNISNRLSIGTDYDVCSLSKSVNFKKKFTEPIFTHFSGSAERSASANNALKSATELKDMLNALRIHYRPDENKLFTRGSTKSVCMHQSALGSHTTGSFAVVFNSIPCIWTTGSSSPCVSIFKPVFLGYNTPPVFVDAKNSLHYWLQREYLHRAIFSGIIDVHKYLKKARLLEDSFINEYAQLMNNNVDFDTLIAFSVKCSEEEQKFIDSYNRVIEDVKTATVQLSPIWKHRTETLGQNVFSKKIIDHK